MDKTKSYQKGGDIKMDERTVRLLSLFALGPCADLSCTRDHRAKAYLLDCINSGSCDQAERLLRTLQNLFPYWRMLFLLGRDMGYGVFESSYMAAEAYIYGNSLIESATRSHFEWVLDFMRDQGKTDSQLDSMRRNSTVHFIPLHAYQVILSNLGAVGRFSNAFLTKTQECFVRIGTVSEVRGDEFLVNLPFYHIDSGDIEKVYMERSVHLPEKSFLQISAGMIVSTHRGYVMEVMTQNQERVLEVWTKQAIKLFLEKE